MIVVGLTGGIGSGKTTVAKLFATYGVPIYIADEEAKLLMNRSKVIRRKLTELFGKRAYLKSGLNRNHLAKKIFNDKTLLDQMNAIVHPKVASHFKRWLRRQNTSYVIKEAAIIFEHNNQSKYDYIITVVADKKERINRVLSRPNMTKNRVLSIMNNQLSDAEKVKKSDFVILNNSLSETKQQVHEIHKKLTELSK